MKKTSKKKKSKKKKQKKPKKNGQEKKKPGKKRYAKVCPKCGSADISIEKTNPLQPALGLPERYACASCGFAGRNFPEVELSKLEKIRAEGNGKRVKSELVDTAYGKVMVSRVFKLYGLIIVVLGAILFTTNRMLGVAAIVAGAFLIFLNPIARKLRK